MKRQHFRKLYFLNIVIFVVGIVVFLTGCTTDYDRGDIKEYVEETYHLKNVQVAKKAIEVEDEEGYTDYLWKVRLKDQPDVEFNVLDDYGWGSEWVTNYLHSDYESVMLAKLFKEYGKSDRISLVEEEEDGLAWTYLTGGYGNREEIRRIYDELMSFHDYVASTGYRVENSLSIDLQMENPLREQVVFGDDGYPVDDGDFYTHVTSLSDETLQQMEILYLQVCIDYRFMEQLGEFSQEEIENAVSQHDYRIAVSQSGTEDGPYIYYKDLCASRFAYGVSFGTLYEILAREGLEVSGDVWHYAFTGADGSIYEVSYDFVGESPETEYDESVEKHYYYLKDGEIVWMEAYFYNHFSERMVKELTGLEIYTGTQIAEGVVYQEL